MTNNSNNNNNNNAPGANLVEWLLNQPREIFDMVVGELPLADQAALASTNRDLRRLVRPVLNGWVFQNPPVPFPQMMQGEQMRWEYVLYAESQADNGYVACQWCHNIHDPLASIDPNERQFPCRLAPRSSMETAHHPVSMYERPLLWHPLVLYAFMRYSKQHRDTSRLRAEAQLDSSKQTYYESAHGPGQPPRLLAREEWKLTWLPRGEDNLFAWHRVSKVVGEDDKGSLRTPCCPCQRNQKTVRFDELRRGNFADAVTVEYQPLDDDWSDDDDPEEQVMLSEEGRRSPHLVVGKVWGCGSCAVDFQAAWETQPDAPPVLHWTTWYNLGHPDTVDKVLRVLTPRHTGRSLFMIGPLGIGNIAKTSQFPDEY